MFIFNNFSTCFGHHYAHLQENKTMMPEICWEIVKNKHLTVASCWFSLSLHNLLTMHGHRNLMFVEYISEFLSSFIALCTNFILFIHKQLRSACCVRQWTVAIWKRIICSLRSVLHPAISLSHHKLSTYALSTVFIFRSVKTRPAKLQKQIILVYVFRRSTFVANTLIR